MTDKEEEKKRRCANKFNLDGDAFMSNTQKALVAVLTIAIAAASGIVFDASAATKKKLSYEQAWAHCKALLDAEKQPGETSSGQHRIFRGRACMEKYGYKI